MTELSAARERFRLRAMSPVRALEPMARSIQTLLRYSHHYFLIILYSIVRERTEPYIPHELSWDAVYNSEMKAQETHNIRLTLKHISSSGEG